MLLNYSAVHGLPAVDVSNGSKVGEVRSFSITFDGEIKGILVKRFRGGVILVEPSHVLGLGLAAAVVNLDEHATVVSPEHIENCLILDRPIISLAGNPAGKLLDCSVDVASMEIKEISIQPPDQEVEVTIPSEQVRTLGRQFIILENDLDVILSQKAEPIALVKKEVPGPEVVTAKAVPVTAALEAAPSNLKADRDLEKKTELSFMILDRTLGSHLDRLTKPGLSHDKGEVSDAGEDMPLAADLVDLEDQIEALVDKSFGRTLAVDNGGTRQVFEIGTIITREMAKDLAAKMPMSLELLSLFVK